jgi:hypothetical protein
VRRLRTAVAVLPLVAAGALGGCSGGDEVKPNGGGSSAESSTGPTTIDITIKDGTVSPNGTRVEARVGEPVRLHIHADAAGELHVHSTPEQEIEFRAGTSTRRLTVDKPGIVDVEDHHLDQVIVQLEVS